MMVEPKAHKKQFRFDDETVQLLEKLSELTRLNKSEVIRQLILKEAIEKGIVE